VRIKHPRDLNGDEREDRVALATWSPLSASTDVRAGKRVKRTHCAWHYPGGLQPLWQHFMRREFGNRSADFVGRRNGAQGRNRTTDTAIFSPWRRFSNHLLQVLKI